MHWGIRQLESVTIARLSICCYLLARGPRSCTSLASENTQHIYCSDMAALVRSSEFQANSVSQVPVPCMVCAWYMRYCIIFYYIALQYIALYHIALLLYYSPYCHSQDSMLLNCADQYRMKPAIACCFLALLALRLCNGILFVRFTVRNHSPVALRINVGHTVGNGTESSSYCYLLPRDPARGGSTVSQCVLRATDNGMGFNGGRIERFCPGVGSNGWSHVIQVSGTNPGQQCFAA